MAGEPTLDGAPSSRIDGHKLSEFIYGTITGMAALSAGLGFAIVAVEFAVHH